ncbi:MAG: adenylate/guanylate cyclase domain-containing protein [Dehalococcoidia bacterium]
MEPRIQYAQTEDGVSIAYWSLGQGVPILYMRGAPFTHLQMEWQRATYRQWYEPMLERWRVVCFDTRGSGMSERGVSDFSVEAQALDIAAVADRLELDSFALMASTSSGLAAVQYAAVNPQRVSHLALIDGYPSGPEFFDIPQVKAFRAMLDADWDMFTETLAQVLFGWSGGEKAREMAALLRGCVEQQQAIAFMDTIASVDVTPLLAQITQATVVLHHASIPFPTMDTTRLLASRIADSRLVVLEGNWETPGIDLDVLIRALEDLLGTGAPAAALSSGTSGGLATILFTDIEGSTALTQRLGDARARDLIRQHERLVREQLAAHGGAEVKTMGDGFMASFSSATRALECAAAMQRAFAERNASLPARPEPVEGRGPAHGSTGSPRAEAASEPLHIRIGLNAGEPIAEEQDLFGTAVIAAARIAAMAEGGEILVSDVVRQLVAGKGFMFADRGDAELRGFDDPVRIYELRWREE